MQSSLTMLLEHSEAGLTLQFLHGFTTSSRLKDVLTVLSTQDFTGQSLHMSLSMTSIQAVRMPAIQVETTHVRM